MNIPKIIERIKKGEDQRTEFKESFRTNRFGDIDKNLPSKISRAICGFLNSTGGDLFIGVDDSGNIVGIEKDIESYSKSDYMKGKDLLLKQVSNNIRQNVGNLAVDKVEPIFYQDPNYPE